jgi:hypothetical protein
MFAKMAYTRSGRSIFTRIPAIDLSTAQDAAYSLDFDLDDEEAELADRRAAGGDPSAQASLAPSSALGSRIASRAGSAQGSRSSTPVPGARSKAQSESQAFLLAVDSEIEDLESGDSRPR